MTRTIHLLLLGAALVACQPVDAVAPDGGADAVPADARPPVDAEADAAPGLDTGVAPPDAVAGDAAPSADATWPDAGRADAEPVEDARPADARTPDAGRADAAPSGCEPASVETRRCGLNDRGEQARVCTGDGFSPWGQCIDPDACVDDELGVDTCENGIRQRRCRGGQWGPWRCETDRCLPWQFTDIDVEGQVWLGDATVDAFSQHRGSCGGDGVEVTYQLQVAQRAALCLRAVGHGIDPLLYVRRACRDPGSEVGCDDDGGGLTTAQLRLTLEPGAYVVFVDTADRDAGGQFSLYVLEQTADGDCPEPE
ncbi:MAG: hypothetical protein H6704_02850 [Myxococcales bacterium]|nr:hypothetical protein [Myxococcales bacterium]